MREYNITEVINNNVEVKLNNTKLGKFTKKEMEKIFKIFIKNGLVDKESSYRIDFTYDIKIKEMMKSE